MSFIENRINNLIWYKEKILKCDMTKPDYFRNHKYWYFLTGDDADKTFQSNNIHRNNNKITIDGYDKDIALHSYWKHMNSSQVMGINFFADYCNNTELLTNIFVKIIFNNENTIINGKPISLEFERNESDDSSIDLVIHLDNGHRINIEIKYTERTFGKTKKSTSNDTYKTIKEEKHKDVIITYENYKKHYQFIRNIVLSKKKSGNYTLFLFPRGNKSIEKKYNNAVKCVKNIKDYNVGKLYWEDVLEVLPNEDFKLRYFEYNMPSDNTKIYNKS